MANREEYNACMRPFITGSKPKEQRKRDFCVGAKICSGKAQTEEEAADLCAKALPKWAQKALPKEEENLSCDMRIERVRKNIEGFELGLKSGDIVEMKPVFAQFLDDISKCRPGPIKELAEVIAGDMRELSKRYYLKGEARDVINQMSALKELL